MTDEPSSETAESPESPDRLERGDRRSRFRRLVGKLAFELDERLGPGDLAQLRRLRPEVAPGAPAFWRLATGPLEPEGYQLAWGHDPDEREARWAVILAAMARLQGFHDPKVPLGRALAEAGVSEGRLLRLLRARGVALFDTLRVTVHQIANGAQRVDCAELAELVLTSGRDDEDSIRRRVARHYYGQLRAKSRSETAAPAA